MDDLSQATRSPSAMISDHGRGRAVIRCTVLILSRAGSLGTSVTVENRAINAGHLVGAVCYVEPRKG